MITMIRQLLRIAGWYMYGDHLSHSPIICYPSFGKPRFDYIATALPHISSLSVTNTGNSKTPETVRVGDS